MIRNLVRKKLSRRALRRSALIVVIKVLISAFTVQACAQAGPAARFALGRENPERCVSALQCIGILNRKARDVVEDQVHDADGPDHAIGVLTIKGKVVWVLPCSSTYHSFNRQHLE